MPQFPPAWAYPQLEAWGLSSPSPSEWYCVTIIVQWAIRSTSLSGAHQVCSSAAAVCGSSEVGGLHLMRLLLKGGLHCGWPPPAQLWWTGLQFQCSPAPFFLKSSFSFSQFFCLSHTKRTHGEIFSFASDVGWHSAYISTFFTEIAIQYHFS